MSLQFGWHPFISPLVSLRLCIFFSCVWLNWCDPTAIINHGLNESARVECVQKDKFPPDVPQTYKLISWDVPNNIHKCRSLFCELNLLLSLYKPEIWQMLSCKINYYTQNALHNCETHFVMQQCIKSYCIAIYFAHMCSEGSATHTETLGFNKRLIVWKEKCVCFSFLLLFSCLNVKHVVRWIPLETIWLKLKVKRLFERQESAKESGNVVQI